MRLCDIRERQPDYVGTARGHSRTATVMQEGAGGRGGRSVG